VLIDADDHHGVAVIEAARLEALARPGEILATDMVRMLAHRRSNVSFEEVGERTLKGLDQAVMVHRVLDLSMSAVPPLPRVPTGSHRLWLVGREHHVAPWRSPSAITPSLSASSTTPSARPIRPARSSKP